MISGKRMKRNTRAWREKDGILVHDGDCRFWDLGICTCGLIHHQMPQRLELSDAEIDKHWKDRARHERAIDFLLNHYAESEERWQSIGLA